MAERSTIAFIGRAMAGAGLVVMGAMGILRDVGSTPPAATPRPAARTAGEDRTWSRHAARRTAEVAAALEREPGRPELHLRMARCLYLRMAAEALYQYQIAYPSGFADGSSISEGQYDDWRRGWFARDRDGVLRRAVRHARRAATPQAPLGTRVPALQLLATLFRECGRDSHALAPLLTARQIDPRNPSTAIVLRELRRRLRERRAPAHSHREPAFPGAKAPRQRYTVLFTI